MSVAARPWSLARRASAADKIPGEAVRGDELERAVDILAGAVGLAERDLGAGAVEMRLAAQRLARDSACGKSGVERLQRARGLAGGEPGIALLDAESGAGGIVPPPRRRAPPAGRPSPPPAIARARYKQGRGSAARRAAPRPARPARHWRCPPPAAARCGRARCRRAAARCRSAESGGLDGGERQQGQNHKVSSRVETVAIRRAISWSRDRR